MIRQCEVVTKLVCHASMLKCDDVRLMHVCVITYIHTYIHKCVYMYQKYIIAYLSFLISFILNTDGDGQTALTEKPCSNMCGMYVYSMVQEVPAAVPVSSYLCSKFKQ